MPTTEVINEVFQIYGFGGLLVIGQFALIRWLMKELEKAKQRNTDMADKQLKVMETVFQFIQNVKR